MDCAELGLITSSTEFWKYLYRPLIRNYGSDRGAVPRKLHFRLINRSLALRRDSVAAFKALSERTSVVNKGEVSFRGCGISMTVGAEKTRGEVLAVKYGITGSRYSLGIDVEPCSRRGIDFTSFSSVHCAQTTCTPQCIHALAGLVFAVKRLLYQSLLAPAFYEIRECTLSSLNDLYRDENYTSGVPSSLSTLLSLNCRLIVSVTTIRIYGLAILAVTTFCSMTLVTTLANQVAKKL